MFIEYGINEHGELIYIDQVPRGQTSLACPYCNGALIAKKGDVISHHFAHAGETCRQVERDQEIISLPAYDRFNLNLPGKAIKLLEQYGADRRFTYTADWKFLESLDLAQFNEWAGRGGDWELTKLGKIPLGELSLMLFNQLQEPLILEKHDDLSQAAERVRRLPEFETRLTDLRLYRAQYRRILTCTLYFLQIGETLHKIGVTTRPIEQRVVEIKTDLLPHLGNVPIKVLGTWPHRGNVELYFKYRYRAAQHPIGSLTEYYQFEDITPVLRDLRRMKPKALHWLEQGILNGWPSPLEQQIESEAIEQRRRIMIKVGMQRAAKRGKHVGRPQGKESAEEFLAKPTSAYVQSMLTGGAGVRETARLVGVSINFVRKVKALMGD
jgi:hypothetical protein